MLLNLAFVGSGNVANALALVFYKIGHTISFIHSRNTITGNELAKKTNSIFHKTLPKTLDTIDVFFICTNDNHIEFISNSLPSSDSLICHCSGGTSIKALSAHKYHGVFYPLQTISNNKTVSFENIPILIESNFEEKQSLLTNLAKSISHEIRILNSINRKKLHLAAVICNNFTTHLLQLTKEYCVSNNLDYNLLKPLIEQTLKNATSDDNNIQTGPAIRGDYKTIDEHLNLLDSNPKLQHIYQFFSKSIST